MRLVLPTRVRAVLSAHAEASLPAAGCGLLLGGSGTGEVRVTRALPCPNVAVPARRRWGFEIDPGAVVGVSRSLRGTGERIVGFFHSRTDGGMRLHPSDRRSLQLWPETVWLAVAAAGSGPALRAWWRSGRGEGSLQELEIAAPAETTARSLCPE